MPGWRHLWDNVIRKGLSSLSFFPRFLELLKSVASFLRDTSNLHELYRRLRAARLPELAAAVLRLRVRGIAEWRWATLGRCTRGVNTVLISLANVFDVSWFTVSRDSKKLCNVAEAFFLGATDAAVSFHTVDCTMVRTNLGVDRLLRMP